MTDDPVTECEVCGAPVQRVLHPVAVHFKGKGFYNTDYGTKKRQRELKAAGEGSSSGSGDSSSSDASSSGDSSSKDSGSSSSAGTPARRPRRATAAPRARPRRATPPAPDDAAPGGAARKPGRDLGLLLPADQVRPAGLLAGRDRVRAHGRRRARAVAAVPLARRRGPGRPAGHPPATARRPRPGGRRRGGAVHADLLRRARGALGPDGDPDLPVADLRRAVRARPRHQRAPARRAVARPRGGPGRRGRAGRPRVGLVAVAVPRRGGRARRLGLLRPRVVRGQGRLPRNAVDRRQHLLGHRRRGADPAGRAGHGRAARARPRTGGGARCAGRRPHGPRPR